MSWLKRLMLGTPTGSSKKDTGPAPTSVADSAYEKTATGLEYHDIKVGAGASPSKGAQVVVHYSGWLTNGKRFDSSVVRGKPFSFMVGRRKVIKGWDEGVMSMKVGGVRQLKVPPALGYGARGDPPVIPVNATLIFEIELLEIG
jgi:FKBP-type peptidyl-prolyl cis-trans isomerase